MIVSVNLRPRVRHLMTIFVFISRHKWWWSWGEGGGDTLWCLFKWPCIKLHAILEVSLRLCPLPFLSKRLPNSVFFLFPYSVIQVGSILNSQRLNNVMAEVSLLIWKGNCGGAHNNSNNHDGINYIWLIIIIIKIIIVIMTTMRKSWLWWWWWQW